MSANNRPEPETPEVVDEDQPHRVDDLPAVAPWWPYARQLTYRLIAGTYDDGPRLRAVRVGRRKILVTVRALREFVREREAWDGASNTNKATPATQAG